MSYGNPHDYGTSPQIWLCAICAMPFSAGLHRLRATTAGVAAESRPDAGFTDFAASFHRLNSGFNVIEPTKNKENIINIYIIKYLYMIYIYIISNDIIYIKL